MRHGKSSWEYNVGDLDRPLLQKGIHDAHNVAEIFAQTGLSLDFAFSSPANRALHTAMICLRETQHSLEKFSINENLYDFTGEQALKFITDLNQELENVILFGHNYAFTYLANTLGNKHIENVPTSGLVHIRFEENSWDKISKGNTVNTIFPKQIR